MPPSAPDSARESIPSRPRRQALGKTGSGGGVCVDTVEGRAKYGVSPVANPAGGVSVWGCAGKSQPKKLPLQDAIEKADVLIEALQWIRKFRGKITVIKLGGSVMEDPRASTHLLLDVVFMETVGMRPVLVHGGGAAISRAMAEAGLEPRFVQGRRYTDGETLAIVERVLAYEINEGIAAQIEELGGRAKPLNFRTRNVCFGGMPD